MSVLRLLRIPFVAIWVLLALATGVSVILAFAEIAMPEPERQSIGYDEGLGLGYGERLNLREIDRRNYETAAEKMLFETTQ